MKETLLRFATREVTLESLRQHKVYAGLLEGLPTDAQNRRHIAAVMADAKRIADGGAAHLIEPVQTPIAYEGRYPFGAPMALPEVAVIAALRSYSSARDPDADYSTLVVVWFQDHFALPVAPEIEAKLRELSWEALASDENY